MLLKTHTVIFEVEKISYLKKSYLRAKIRHQLSFKKKCHFKENTHLIATNDLHTICFALCFNLFLFFIIQLYDFGSFEHHHTFTEILHFGSLWDF